MSSTTQTGTTLQIDRLVKRFGGITAVDEVSFELAGNGITGVIGPNGAGKTTLFNLISGAYNPTKGKIRFNGERIDQYASHQIADRGIGRTFQISRPFGEMSVQENLITANYDLPKATRRRRVEDVLAMLDLTHQADVLGKNLSGGQQTLLEIGRVLMFDPALVLLDEPAAGVNPKLVDDIASLITETSDERMYMIVEHDITLISRLCERVLVLNEGELIADDSIDVIKNDSRVKKAYLGE
jgi:branched-chain amino acid transport system ATP-binding protein